MVFENPIIIGSSKNLTVTAINGSITLTAMSNNPSVPAR